MYLCPWEFLCVLNQRGLNGKNFYGMHLRTADEYNFFHNKTEINFRVNNYNEFQDYIGLFKVLTE